MEPLDSNREPSHVAKRDHQFQNPVSGENLPGEIIKQWSFRQTFRRAMCVQEAEILKRDAVLGELFFQMKRKLCRVGRNGGWSEWLRQQEIPRSTADRLALDYAEFYGLNDEFPDHEGEPREVKICQAAYRTADRLENMLKSPQSRMLFVRCLADFFELSVEFEGDGVLDRKST